MPSKKVKKRNTWSLRKTLITLVVSLAGIGLGSLMNSDRIASQTFHNQIKTLSNKWKEQKQATQKAKEEAEEIRKNKQSQFLITCVQTTKEAVSESIRS